MFKKITVDIFVHRYAVHLICILINFIQIIVNNYFSKIATEKILYSDSKDKLVNLVQAIKCFYVINVMTISFIILIICFKGYTEFDNILIIYFCLGAYYVSSNINLLFRRDEIFGMTSNYSIEYELGFYYNFYNLNMIIIAFCLNPILAGVIIINVFYYICYILYWLYVNTIKDITIAYEI